MVIWYFIMNIDPKLYPEKNPHWIHIIRFGDWIIIAPVITAAVISMIHFHLTPSPGIEIVVMGDNRMQENHSLGKNQTVTIAGVLGNTDITIQDRKAWISKAPCPHQICVNMGKISREGESLVCLPNRVLVFITGKADNTIDAVTQ